MAEIVESNREPEHQKVNTSYPVWEVAILGVVLGIMYWILTSLLTNLVFDSIKISGDIAMIILATIGLIVLMRLKIARPLMIVVAAAASLWSLAVWTSGLAWSLVILWNIILYVFSYVLFSWLARFNNTIVAMLMMLFVIVVIRIIVVM